MELQKVVIGTEEIMTGRQTKTGSLADAKIAELVSLAEKFPLLPKCVNVELKAEIGKSTFWQRAKKVEKAIGLIIKGNVDDAGNTTTVKCAWSTEKAKTAFIENTLLAAKTTLEKAKTAEIAMKTPTEKTAQRELVAIVEAKIAELEAILSPKKAK